MGLHTINSYSIHMWGDTKIKVVLGQPGRCIARGIEAVCLQVSVTKRVNGC